MNEKNSQYPSFTYFPLKWCKKSCQTNKENYMHIHKNNKHTSEKNKSGVRNEN